MKKLILAVKKIDYDNFVRNLTDKCVPDLRFGDVSYHKDLLRPDEYCLGGGIFEFTEDSLILSGQSSDYGRPKFTSSDKDLFMTGLRCSEDAIMPNIYYTFKEDYYPYNQLEDIDIKPLIIETYGD
jgi:hypothetical protein